MGGYEECPKCNRRSLRQRALDRTWKCYSCRAVFNPEKKFIAYDKENKLIADENGNFFFVETEKTKNTIIQKKVYLLEEGKSTLRGKYPKFRTDCPFPDRLDCNNGVGYERCEYMQFVSVGNWKCSYGEK